MNRRHFLFAGLAGFAFSSGRSLADRGTVMSDAPTPGDFCHSRPFGVLPVSAAPRRAGELRYQGTHILTHGAFRDLAAAYRGPHGRWVTVAGGGCDDGIATVRRESADLGGLCCPVPGSRAEGMPWLLVARDIKVAVAHIENPVSYVSLEDLRAVARGKLVDWRALGGEDRTVALVVRRHCPDYFEPVRETLLGGRTDWAPRGLFVERDEQIVDMVSRYRGGLGLVSWVFAKPLVEAGRLKCLAVDGVPPGATEVQAGRYPLHGPLSVVYRRWEAQDMRPFFDFLYGPGGAAIVGRALVPVSADAAGYAPARWV